MNEQKGASAGAGLKLGVGEYRIKLKEVKGVQTRQKGPAMDFIFEVVKASPNAVTAVGSTVNEYCLEQNDIGAMYLKTLLVCLLGLDENRAEDKPLVKAEDWNVVREGVVAMPERFIGRELCCTVVSQPYAKPNAKGTHYDRRTYAPSPELRAETLKKLEAAKAAKK